MTLLIGRVVQSQAGPPLELWHTFIPTEPDAAAIDRLDWGGYLAAEAKTFASVRTEVTDRLEAKDRRPDDRYFAGSPMYAGGFAQDRNRSYVLEPVGRPVGVVVLLHGLTDSPYSLRHVAQLYRARGWLSCAFPATARCPPGLPAPPGRIGWRQRGLRFVRRVAGSHPRHRCISWATPRAARPR
jgi:hypothetical protein